MALVGLLEDNPRIAKMCATMLYYAGHQVVLYKHPQECLQALLVSATESGAPVLAGESKREAVTMPSLPIDLLILDLYMPGMAGAEVLRLLQSHTHTRDLPLILCTAATRREIERARSIAPHAVVVEKPFKLQALTEAIAASLKLSSSRT